MVKLYDSGVYLVGGETLVSDPAQLPSLCGRMVTKEEAEKGTIAYGILSAPGDRPHPSNSGALQLFGPSGAGRFYVR